MLAIPAIDLGGARDAAGTGTAGEGPERADDPRDVARRWVAAGFSRFHLMDLDAESDRDESRHLVRDLLRDMQEVGGVTVQVGGGVRETEDIVALLRDGAEQVVVGQRGTDDPGWLDTQAALAPGRLILSVELLRRRVVGRGWASAPRRTVDDVIADLEGLPLAGLLVRALRKDGTHPSIDLALLEDLASNLPWPVIAIGDIASMQDLRNLEDRGVAAAILGPGPRSEALDPRVVAEEFPE